MFFKIPLLENIFWRTCVHNVLKLCTDGQISVHVQKGTCSSLTPSIAPSRPVTCRLFLQIP